MTRVLADLTELEAENLIFAAGEALDHPDVADAVFAGSPVERRAAYRGRRKLREALAIARRKPPNEEER